MRDPAELEIRFDFVVTDVEEGCFRRERRCVILRCDHRGSEFRGLPKRPLTPPKTDSADNQDTTHAEKPDQCSDALNFNVSHFVTVCCIHSTTLSFSCSSIVNIMPSIPQIFSSSRVVRDPAELEIRFDFVVTDVGEDYFVTVACSHFINSGLSRMT